jgi:hypothetical protein
MGAPPVVEELSTTGAASSVVEELALASVSKPRKPGLELHHD